MRRIDLTGQNFGRLSVVKEHGRNKIGRVMWECFCICGNTSYVSTNNLRSGETQSCGCFRKERMLTSITGQRFGRLVALRFDCLDKNHNAKWLCKCDCGKEKVIHHQSLKNGATQSCGCLNKEIVKAHIKHGMVNERIYKAWSSMIQRCTNPNNHKYPRYGGRGINVCDKWLDFSGFYEDMGDRPEGMTLDREDNNGNYEKSNCRWATQKQQANNRGNNKFVTVNGEKMTATQASNMMGYNRSTVSHRLSYGWDEVAAVNTPIHVEYIHNRG